MNRLFRHHLSLTRPPPTTCLRSFSGMGLTMEEVNQRLRRRRSGAPPAPIRELHQRVQSIVNTGGDLKSASRILRESILSGIRPVHTTCSLLMNSMCKAGLYTHVISLFHFLYQEETPAPARGRGGVPFIHAYNALIEAHIKSGNIDQALQIYHQIADKDPIRGFVNSSTYRILTQGLVSANRITQAIHILREMTQKIPFYSTDTVSYTYIIFAYLDQNDVQTAHHLLNEMAAHKLYRCSAELDGIIYARFMEYYFQKNMEKEAMQTYQSFLNTQYGTPHPDACNRLLEVLLKYGKTVEANLLFQSQLNMRCPTGRGFNSLTYTIMVNECFRTWKVSDAISLFKKRSTYEHVNPFPMDTSAYNNIIDKLYNIGEVAEADQFFQELIDKSVKADITTFRIVFDAWFQQERLDDVLKWFSYMLFDTDLNSTTEFLNSVFSRLLNKGRLEEAGEIFERMQHNNIEAFPIFSYELVLSELCKRGKLDQVRSLLCLIDKYNICINPMLHGIVQEAFGKQHRIHQIEGLFEKQIESSTPGV